MGIRDDYDAMGSGDGCGMVGIRDHADAMGIRDECDGRSR